MTMIKLSILLILCEIFPVFITEMDVRLMWTSPYNAIFVSPREFLLCHFRKNKSIYISSSLYKAVPASEAEPPKQYQMKVTKDYRKFSLLSFFPLLSVR
jgi:hypothetical protein